MSSWKPQKTCQTSWKTAHGHIVVGCRCSLRKTLRKMKVWDKKLYFFQNVQNIHATWICKLHKKETLRLFNSDPISYEEIMTILHCGEENLKKPFFQKSTMRRPFLLLFLVRKWRQSHCKWWVISSRSHTIVMGFWIP